MEPWRLGMTGYTQMDKSAVDNMLLHTPLHSLPSCYVCGNTPQYRILPREDKHITAQLQKGLYICGHCLSTGVLDRNLYGIRKLKE